MRKYRLVLLLKSDLKKEAKEKIISEIKRWIGEVKNDKVSGPGERKLAYPIKKEKKGEYVVVDFEAKTLPRDLDKKIVMQEDILRHLIIRD